MFLAKLKLIWQRNWIIITVVLICLFSIAIPVWYMAGMEESVRKYILAFSFVSMPFQIFGTMVFVFFLYLLHFGGGFSRFNKTKMDSGKISVKFADVIGLTEAKKEALEVVALMKDRQRLKQVGGRIVRGMMLVGPPGCGKTLMAKAIAAEAGIPFISVAGSEFVEIYVGVGAARVRQLFEQARQYAKAYGGCMIFIDELEVLGKRRVFYDAFGGSSEGNSTLNQLLVEMDGINDGDANVVVIGAMNAAVDVLDPALVRPGRFDRKIQVTRPNLQEREDIFEYYARKIKVGRDVDFGRLARKAVGKTPAEIENILLEAALIATRNGHDVIGKKDVGQAIERIELGIAHKLNMTEREREMTAYHEAGHLLILFLDHPTEDVFKASIISRGGVLGVVHSMPKEELHCYDRDTLFAHVKVALGGYVAEKIKYGVTTTGVSSDFVTAMTFADTMTWNLGMCQGFLGDFDAINSKDRNHISEEFKAKLNHETQKILHDAEKQVDTDLRKDWNIIERIVTELLKRDELDYDEIVEIFAEFGKQPKKFYTGSMRDRNGAGAPAASPAPAVVPKTNPGTKPADPGKPA